MSYQEFWKPYREETEERFSLVVKRLEQMETEETAAYPYRTYFRHALNIRRGRK